MKIFLLILIALFSSALVSAQNNFDERLKSLVVRAKVLEARIDRTSATYPTGRLKLEVTFTNEGNAPIIILQKIGGYNGFRDLVNSTGVALFGKNASGEVTIQNGGILPSICPDCNAHLGKFLDQKAPPAQYTKILKPGESVTLTEETGFALPLKTANSSLYGWDEIAANDWKVTGKIGYSMFPGNHGKGPDFGQKLQKRWKEHGVLYVGEGYSLITSEKFEIDLTAEKF